MEIGQLLSSINIFAIIALVITLFVFFMQLKPIIFKKKVTKNPVIPDFDGSLHTLSSLDEPARHATHIDVESIESGAGVNITLIVLLLGIMAILVIIIAAGFLFGKKKTVPNQPTGTLSPTAIPTEIIEIGHISPTSPFPESQEVPFDLSGTPILETSTPIPTPLRPTGLPGQAQTLSPTGSPTSAPNYTKSPTTTGASVLVSATSLVTTTSPTPTLPVSGNYHIFVLLTAVPIVLLTLAILL